jgi:hypothetical protein
MKKTLFLLLTASLLPAPVSAQITSLSLRIQPNGSDWQEVIENHASSSVVAVRTTFRPLPETKSKTTAIVVVYDNVTHYGPAPIIPPGGIGYRFAQDPSKWSGGVDAVVFSDGHSEGDPDGVSEIYDGRRGAYRAVTEVLPLLDTIVNQGASPTEVAAAIRRLPVPNDGTMSRGERNMMEAVYQGVENLLRRQMDITGLYDPKKYPSPPSIAEVAKTNGISREQAHAIVISKKYQAFQAFLQDNLEPSAAK